MEFLGIGPLEFLLIVLLALIILGPKDMQNAGRTLGKSLNKLVKSDLWKVFRQTSEKIKYLPNELMREAELEEHRIVPEKRPSEPAQSSLPAGDDTPSEPPKIVPLTGVQPPAEENNAISPITGETPPPDEHQHG